MVLIIGENDEFYGVIFVGEVVDGDIVIVDKQLFKVEVIYVMDWSLVSILECGDFILLFGGAKIKNWLKKYYVFNEKWIGISFFYYIVI